MERIFTKIASWDPNGTRPSDVLIVSDNALMTLDLSMALAPRGFVAVTRPHSAGPDLKAYGTDDYAAIILDVEKKNDALNSMLEWMTAGLTPVFVVSTCAEDASLPKVTAWLDKPLSVEMLFEREAG
ncbi:hypothetical protein [Pseudooceanicola sp. MF1-13]|uniref:hypothetical protein n=1 Tax=Pseudooceanicola sp. MF1-13 TaxID=3379095 RepID=UPI003892429F